MRFFSRRLPENPHLTFIMAFQVQAISSYYGRLTLSGVQSDQLEWLCSAILGAQVRRSYDSFFSLFVVRSREWFGYCCSTLSPA